MSEPWSDRADLYRTSAVHVQGPDLDLMVEWAQGRRTALDVATGGGHVARRLREAGLEVVSCDPAPGMAPDVICHAEDLPFADDAFDGRLGVQLSVAAKEPQPVALDRAAK